MPCYSPLKGYRARTVNESGKRSIVFTPREGFIDLPVEVPCGQCIGCRLERSRQWAIRCVHEAQLHKRNCFLTLTYNDDNLPHDGSLKLEHWQKFAKRMRKRYGSFRFFHCGEYGSKYGRPHYHACIFGFDFPDKYLWSENKSGNKLYRSRSLERLWPYGYCIIGDVTFESAAYVARYIMKKITGEKADEHYNGRKPEYTTMSRRPGIGKEWFDKFKSDVFPHDEVIIRGKKLRPPRYYDTLYEVANPNEFEVIKNERKKMAKRLKADNSSDRLRVKEKVKRSQIQRLKRPVE